MALTDEQATELLRLLEAEARARSRRLIDTIFTDTGPNRRELYQKHVAFLDAGASHRERGLMSGNRCGKSTTAAYELALHLSGAYPAWWRGKRFRHPITAWAAGQSVRDLRDSAERLLLGGLGNLGTGLIPGDAIARVTARSGTPDATDVVHVRHVSGGTSTLTFKTYESGREAFQAANVHVVWCDEEPPHSVYIEALMRTATTDGIVMTTFTPMAGLSATALHFMPGGQAPESAEDGPFLVQIAWDEVPHLNAATKHELLQSIPPAMRDARTKGIPQLGSGAIYPIPAEEIICEPFQTPAWYRHCFALDVGWNRTACLWGAVDPENDTAFLYDEYYRGQAEPAVHAAAIRARGPWVPGVIDPAARGRSQADGKALFNQYVDMGLEMLTPADNKVEAGIYEVWSRLSTGRLRVFKTLQNFLSEYRIYRRDEAGKIVKQNDHLVDCCRYLCMSGIQIAAQRPAREWAGRPGSPASWGDGRFESEYRPYQAAWNVASDMQPRSASGVGSWGRIGR